MKQVPKSQKKNKNAFSTILLSHFILSGIFFFHKGSFCILYFLLTVNGAFLGCTEYPQTSDKR